MGARINLTVDDDIPDKLLALAGSQRKMGTWLTDMVRKAHDEQTDPDQMPPELVKLIEGYRGMHKFAHDMEEFKKWKESRDHGV
jgi:hypothetical protein